MHKKYTAVHLPTQLCRSNMGQYSSAPAPNWSSIQASKSSKNQGSRRIIKIHKINILSISATMYYDTRHKYRHTAKYLAKKP